jgi:hypothetical protein
LKDPYIYGDRYGAMLFNVGGQTALDLKGGICVDVDVGVLCTVVVDVNVFVLE